MTLDIPTPAVPGGTNVVAFPRRRTVPAASFGSIMRLDGYDLCFAAVHIAERFGESDDRPTLETVREIMHEEAADGPLLIARLLEHNAYAIDFLRSSLAYLVAADERIAAAADTVLAEAGR